MQYTPKFLLTVIENEDILSCIYTSKELFELVSENYELFKKETVSAIECSPLCSVLETAEKENLILLSKNIDIAVNFMEIYNSYSDFILEINHVDFENLDLYLTNTKNRIDYETMKLMDPSFERSTENSTGLSNSEIDRLIKDRQQNIINRLTILQNELDNNPGLA